MSRSSLQALRKLSREAEALRGVLDGLLLKTQELVEISQDYLGFAQKMD